VFAIVAAIIFAIAFVLDLLNKSYNNLLNANTLVALGLVFVALHMAPLGRYRLSRR
jgi:hypothetical protein